MAEGRIPIGVAAYSFPCGCGFARRAGEPPIEAPLDAWGMIDLALAHGLSAVEIPLRGMLADLSDATTIPGFERLNPRHEMQTASAGLEHRVAGRLVAAPQDDQVLLFVCVAPGEERLEIDLEDAGFEQIEDAVARLLRRLEVPHQFPRAVSRILPGDQAPEFEGHRHSPSIAQSVRAPTAKYGGRPSRDALFA